MLAPCPSIRVAALAVAMALAPRPTSALQDPALPPAAAARGEAVLNDARGRPEVEAALRHLDGARDATAESLVEIGGIVSPSGEEQDRAAAVAARMRAIGLDSVRVTEDPNAIGVIPGRSGRALIFVSTLDDLATVAEHQRAAGVPPRIQGDRVVGPGTNTSLTTAAVLAAAEALIASGSSPSTRWSSQASLRRRRA